MEGEKGGKEVEDQGGGRREEEIRLKTRGISKEEPVEGEERRSMTGKRKRQR
jgi:hypothetical protein